MEQNEFSTMEWKLNRMPLYVIVFTAVFSLLAASMLSAAAYFLADDLLRWLFAAAALSILLLEWAVMRQQLRLWHYTRTHQEYVRLDDEGFHYHVYPYGEGSLKYEWLRNLSEDSVRFPHLLIEYRHPEQTSILLQVLELPIRTTIATQVKREIIKRCHPGQLYPL